MLAKTEVFGATHLCKSEICASGAIFAASLECEHSDSALLDYTPCDAKIYIFGATHCVCPRTNRRGAIFAASLTSELVDSALLDYLWILPEPSPPASFSTSARVTIL